MRNALATFGLAALISVAAGCNGAEIATPAGMTHVKKGSFKMGYDGPDATPLEKQDVRFVDMGDFFIDIYEVTNADFYKYCKAKGAQFPAYWKDKLVDGELPADFGKLPVVNVSYGEAEAYALHMGKRLPSEAEWEFAARGSQSLVFPWGNSWVKGNANVFEEGHKGPVAVGTFAGGKSVYSGTFDQSGNVWEWTSTAAPGSTKYYIKGGSFAALEDKPRGSLRGLAEKGDKRGNLGFRCAKSYE